MNKLETVLVAILEVAGSLALIAFFSEIIYGFWKITIETFRDKD